MSEKDEKASFTSYLAAAVTPIVAREIEAERLRRKRRKDRLVVLATILVATIWVVLVAGVIWFSLGAGS